MMGIVVKTDLRHAYVILWNDFISPDQQVLPVYIAEGGEVLAFLPSGTGIR
jgi:hypothetical protein